MSFIFKYSFKTSLISIYKQMIPYIKSMTFIVFNHNQKNYQSIQSKDTDSKQETVSSNKP